MQFRTTALGTALAGFGVAARAQTQITGAGSTFAARIYGNRHFAYPA